MTVEELILTLQDMVDDKVLAPDAEVRLAMQPNWPFEHRVGAVAVLQEPCAMCEVEAGCLHEDGCDAGPGVVGGYEPNPGEIVYLAEGGQIGYLPGTARQAVGW